MKTGSLRLTEQIVNLLRMAGETGRISDPAAGGWPISIDHPEETLSDCLAADLLEPATDNTMEYRLSVAGRDTLRSVNDRLVSADKLRPGEPARLAFLRTANHSRFQKLAALGLTPGVPVMVRQRFPSFVIQCEETQIALAEEIARDILVWRE
ncbi:MAG: FeoA family protein [Blastocatellia bacterium]